MYASEITYTEKIDKLIQEKMLSSLELMVDPAGDDILYKLKSNVKLSSKDKQRLFAECREFFPSYCSADTMESVLRELFKIISADDRWIPSLMGEYVLAHALSDFANSVEGNMQDGFDYRLEQGERRIVKDELIKLFEEDKDPAEPMSREEMDAWAEDILSGIEQVKGIEELCFHDCDYLFLDKYTPEELASNGMDSNLRLGATEPARCWGHASYPASAEPASDVESAAITVTVKEMP